MTGNRPLRARSWAVGGGAAEGVNSGTIPTPRQVQVRPQHPRLTGEEPKHRGRSRSAAAAAGGYIKHKKLKLLGFGGSLEVESELEPRCEARAITTHRDRKHVQGSGWGRKIERGMHVELGRLMGCGGTHV